MMRALIAYCTRYGAARRCATHLSQRISGTVDVVDLGATRSVALEQYDAIVIGGSIYAGRIQRQVTSFCEFHERELVVKPVAVYLCCLYQGERATAQLNAAYPDWLLAHAVYAALPGGELRYASLRWLDRLAVRGLPRPGDDVLLMRTAALDALAAAVNTRAGAR
jgi:menaquinone-dependent protoporphyrinogen oxidase